jgi:hypothetical protein
MNCPSFKGWTRADGVREFNCPVDWPFGRINEQAEKSRKCAAATSSFNAARAKHQLEKAKHGTGKQK